MINKFDLQLFADESPETIEEAAMVHGINLNELMEALNK